MFRRFSFSSVVVATCCQRMNSTTSSSSFAEKNKNLKLALADLESVLGTTPTPLKEEENKVIVSKAPPKPPPRPPTPPSPPSTHHQPQNAKQDNIDFEKKERILNRKAAAQEEPIINKKDKLIERVLTDQLFQNAMIYRSGEATSTSKSSSNNQDSSESTSTAAALPAYAVESLAWDSSATVEDYRNLVRVLISISKKEVWDVVLKRVGENTLMVDAQLNEVDRKLKEFRNIREEIRELLREFKAVQNINTNTSSSDIEQVAAAEEKSTTTIRTSSNDNNDQLPDFKLVAKYSSVLELPVLKGKHIREIPEDSKIPEIKWSEEEEE